MTITTYEMMTLLATYGIMMTGVLNFTVAIISLIKKK